MKIENRFDTTDFASVLSEKAAAVCDKLKATGVDFTGVAHEVAATMEDCREIEKEIDGAICKNLFLCNSQGTVFYLLLMPGDKPFKTKFLSKQIGSSRLSFASPENMMNILGVTPGSASILALLNDSAKQVDLIIDKPVLENEYICCHPCDNTATLKIKTDDILGAFLPSIGVTFKTVELPDREEI